MPDRFVTTAKGHAEPDMQKYLAELLEWHSGEVGGAAFFSALAQGTDDPGLARKWLTLAQLEQCVAGRLRTVLQARGVQVPATAADRLRGLKSAQEYANLEWRDALNRLQTELLGFVRDFEAAESRMPEDIVPLAQFVTEHERALLEFVTRELAQDGLHSLDRVLRLLGEATSGKVQHRPTPQ
jgi:hypothetical protein